MAINHLAIGRACFVVRAGSLPNGYNQRPGMTLLLADGEPLELEIDGQSVVSADAWLLAPEIRRRFVLEAVDDAPLEPLETDRRRREDCRHVIGGRE